MGESLCHDSTWIFCHSLSYLVHFVYNYVWTNGPEPFPIIPLKEYRTEWTPRPGDEEDEADEEEGIEMISDDEDDSEAPAPEASAASTIQELIQELGPDTPCGEDGQDGDGSDLASEARDKRLPLEDGDRHDLEGLDPKSDRIHQLERMLLAARKEATAKTLVTISNNVFFNYLKFVQSCIYIICCAMIRIWFIFP